MLAIEDCGLIELCKPVLRIAGSTELPCGHTHRYLMPKLSFRNHAKWAVVHTILQPWNLAKTFKIKKLFCVP